MRRKLYFPILLLLIVIPVCVSAQKQEDIPVTLTRKGKVFEIRNGLLGIVIPSEALFDTITPAPIQSFIYKDNSYSDETRNNLVSPTKATSMTVSFLIKTREQIKVRILYKFQKPQFVYGKQTYKGGDAGNGFYSFTLWLKKGEKSALIEEESDYDISYIVGVTNGLNPDRARYRGWASDDKALGYEEPTGLRYRSEDERWYPLDATVNLDYSKPYLFYWFKPWEPAGGEQNTGRYWQLYNNTAGTNANLIGYFQGQPSRVIGGRAVGVRLQILPDDPKAKLLNQAFFSISMDRRGPDNSWYPHKRCQWGIFISTKKDLLSPEKTQPIALEMNKYSGLALVIKSYVQKPVKIIPAFYEAGIYTSGKEIKKICRQMKTHENVYKWFCEIDGNHKMIWDVWRYKDSALSIKKFLLDFYDGLPDMYINGEGTFTREFRYWKGTRMFKLYASVIAALFADEEIKIEPDERIKLEKLIGAMARILWDDNNAPLFESAGVNFGPANMYYMYANGRTFFALLLANDPEFSKRAKSVSQNVKHDLSTAIYSNGASFGTPHYTQPTIEPLLFSMLQLRQAGIEDLFKNSKEIKKFARFYLTLLTPPSVRFMLNRKLISFGDGSEESTATFGLMAEGLKDIDPQLSNELSYAFHHGPARGTTLGSVGLAINLLLVDKEVKPFIKTTNYKGYLSHFRNALNTDYETALWALNGDSLFDHRNDDAGEFALYALGAPLSLSRSSFYYPYATDGRVRSIVIPADQFPEWSDSEHPISQRSLTNRTWPKSEELEFASLGKSNSVLIKMSANKGQVWYRKIIEVVLDDKLPIFAFYDSISGGSEKNIWSMMMMSQGAIKTPVGQIIPESRLSDHKKEIVLPKGTKALSLKSGINKFGFTGQNWIVHPTKGINWDFYTNSRASQDISFAQWGTTWQNGVEILEFFQTNKVWYSEEQQIIRIKGGKTFFNLLLPYYKGSNPYDNNVGALSPGIFKLKQNNKTIYISADYYYAKDDNDFCGALLAPGSSLNVDGISIVGGYTEVEFDAKSVKIRLGGNSGQRKITLPFLIKPESSLGGVKIDNSTTGTVFTIPFKAQESEINNKSIVEKEYIFKR